MRKQRLAAAKADPTINPREINALALSGGGDNGAYGAGLPTGLDCQRGTRPPFDVVTGISAGALIAPFAFLGPDYDPQCCGGVHPDGRRLRPDPAAAGRLRFVVFKRFAFADTSPLPTRLIQRHADAAMLAAIAQENTAAAGCC